VHLCLRCRHKLDEVPDEVLVEVRLSETETRTVDLADELKRMQEEMRARYKYVHYCPKLKAILVGGDSPAQQRKKCERYEE